MIGGTNLNNEGKGNTLEEEENWRCNICRRLNHVSFDIC